MIFVDLAEFRKSTHPPIGSVFRNENLRLHDEPLPGDWGNFYAGNVVERLLDSPKGYGIEVNDDRIEGVTPQNHHLKKEIWKLGKRYEKEGNHDGVVFTFQAMNINRMFGLLNARQQEHANLGGYWDWKYQPNDTVALLTVGKCSYFEQLAMVRGDIPGMQPTYGILVASIVETSDGNLVFGIRKGNAEDMVGAFGGTLNFDEGVEDPNHAIRDELKTELGLNVKLVEPRLVAIVGDSVVNKVGSFARPVFCYSTKVDLSSEKLIETFERNPKAKEEHKELILIPKSEQGIREFMKSYNPEQLHPPAGAILFGAMEQNIGLMKSAVN